MFRSFDWDFRSNREILDIQSTWQALGPYEWRASDNDTYGVYIVAREASTNLRIKVSGQRPDYTLEIHFDVPPDRMEQTRDEVVKNVFVSLLPAANATNVRPSGKPMADP
jgi:hypothetical protein